MTKTLIIIHTHIHVTSLAIVKNRAISKVQNKHLYLAIPTQTCLYWHNTTLRPFSTLLDVLRSTRSSFLKQKLPNGVINVVTRQV